MLCSLLNLFIVSGSSIWTLVGAFWVAWVLVLAVFYFLGLDMGPGVEIQIP